MLHVFGPVGGTDVWDSPGVALDSHGNLYGIGFYGGISGNGGVFELIPNTGGGWTENILYSFSGGQDGANPGSTPVLDTAGNLYGTTYYGGGTGCGGIGCGTVFELSPEGASWTETLLYRFAGGTDGSCPAGTLLMDSRSNLYETTITGGGAGACTAYCGTVFELSPVAGGTWQETILHSFQGGADGATPENGVVMDSQGNLYGTTIQGGGLGHCLSNGKNNYCGTVFEIIP